MLASALQLFANACAARASLILQAANALPSDGNSQVGGGIAAVERAKQLLDAGAQRIIFGSALFCGINSIGTVNVALARTIHEEIGTAQFVASIDTKQGQVAVKGWKEQAGLTPQQAIAMLNPYCGAFLYTHVDTEGTMQGFPMAIARELRSLTERQLIVAGGIREQAEIDILHQMRVDAVAGMAVYTGALAT